LANFEAERDETAQINEKRNPDRTLHLLKNFKIIVP
jgi:hypothetical protein